MKLSAYLDGIGMIGPGLDSWIAARPILAGSTPYEARPIAVPAPQSLPLAERRRAGTVVKVALAAGYEAVTAGRLDARQLAAVFSSSGADGDNCDALCKTLASEDRHLSPKTGTSRRPVSTIPCTTPRPVTGALPPAR